MSNGVIRAYGAHLDEIRRVMDERPSTCRPVKRASSIRCWAITRVQSARRKQPWLRLGTPPEARPAGALGVAVDEFVETMRAAQSLAGRGTRTVPCSGAGWVPDDFKRLTDLPRGK